MILRKRQYFSSYICAKQHIYFIIIPTFMKKVFWFFINDNFFILRVYVDIHGIKRVIV